MHQVLHIAVLASTVMGVAGLALLVLWPALFETPLSSRTRGVLAASPVVAAVLLALEWRVVH